MNPNPKAEGFIELRTTNFEMQKNTAKCLFQCSLRLKCSSRLQTANYEMQKNISNGAAGDAACWHGYEHCAEGMTDV